MSCIHIQETYGSILVSDSSVLRSRMPVNFHGGRYGWEKKSRKSRRRSSVQSDTWSTGTRPGSNQILKVPMKQSGHLHWVGNLASTSALNYRSNPIISVPSFTQSVQLVTQQVRLGRSLSESCCARLW